MPRRHASAKAATSRLSVLIRASACPYIKAIVRVGHDDLMAQRFEDWAAHSLSVLASSRIRIGARPPKTRRQRRARRVDASVEHDRPVCLDDPHLAPSRVEIDGTIFHGWLLLCALSASIMWSRRYTQGQPAASSHLSLGGVVRSLRSSRGSCAAASVIESH